MHDNERGGHAANRTRAGAAQFSSQSTGQRSSATCGGLCLFRVATPVLAAQRAAHNQSQHCDRHPQAAQQAT